MFDWLQSSLLRLPPEKAHALALAGLRFAPTLYSADQIGEPHTVMGLRFPNRVGLAAGYDKNGDHINSLAKLGFGFIEIGTITPHPQAGSPTPRLFRVPEAQALINRMGFNNRGAGYAARHLARQGGNFKGVLGCNIGHNRSSSGSQIKDDYLLCLRKLYGLADYFSVNVSSPNTPGLRDLQSPLQLHQLLGSLMELREQLSVTHKERVPMVVKISPDLELREIEAMARIIIDNEISGVIAANTTVSRSREITSYSYGGQPGGLSGAPVRKLAITSLQRWREILPENIAVISTGGIMSGTDARARFDANADLIQLYTGLVYAGPKLISACAKAGVSDGKKPAASVSS